MVSLMASLFAAALVATSTAEAPSRFGEICTGTDTVRIGAQSSRLLPYVLIFYADLQTKTYCFNRCWAEYPIADAASRPIKLLDIDTPKQVRRILFDPTRNSISEFQIVDLGSEKMTRRAMGVCKPSSDFPALRAADPSP